MKIHPCELEFHQTTEEGYKDAIVNGGWIECITRCHIDGCNEDFPHRHYICLCGKIDFAGKDECFGCWEMAKLREIRLMMIEFKKKHGHSMIRLGFSLLVLITFTVASWRFG